MKNWKTTFLGLAILGVNIGAIFCPPLAAVSAKLTAVLTAGLGVASCDHDKGEK
jgi:hypothetical protein